jgi:hypothetical protein
MTVLHRSLARFLVVALAAAIVAPVVATSASASRAAKIALRSDFDGDGFADLAVSSPTQSVNGESGGGAVTVLYGSSGGVTTTRTQFWTTDSPGVLGDAEAGGGFGRALAAGDFNADGFSDLAVGAPGETANGHPSAGAIHILYGGASGLSAAGNMRFTFDSPGVPGTAADDDGFGSSLASASFGRGAPEDLAIGANHDQVDTVLEAGSVTVLYGSTGGLGTHGAQRWTPEKPGVPGVPVDEGDFGGALAAGNFGLGSQADLVIGFPQDIIGGHGDAGSILVVYGTSTGLSIQHIQRFTDESLGGTIDTQDSFGAALAAANFGNNSPLDLAIGVPGDTIDGIAHMGSVYVLYGTSAGLTTDHANQFTQASTATGTNEANDRFGAALAGGNLEGDFAAELVVGVPSEDINTTADAGALSIITGLAESGLSNSGAIGVTQASIGFSVEATDEFGAELAILSLGRGNPNDLVMGTPHEDVGTTQDAGATFITYGSGSGPKFSTTQEIDQDNDGDPSAGVSPTGLFGFTVA